MCVCTLYVYILHIYYSNYNIMYGFTGNRGLTSPPTIIFPCSLGILIILFFIEIFYNFVQENFVDDIYDEAKYSNNIVPKYIYFNRDRKA